MPVSNGTKAAVFFVVALRFALLIAVNMAMRARPGCAFIGFMLVFAGAGLTYALRARSSDVTKGGPN
jgi:hypothetical protein